LQRARRNYRRMAFRPSRDEDRRAENGFALYRRFFARYLWPHRRPLSLCLLLVALNACSVYLLAYYARIVVDRILVVAEAPLPVPDPGASVTFRGQVQSEAARPLHGDLSEYTAKHSGSLRPAGAGRILFLLFIFYAGTLIVLNIAERNGQRIQIRVAQQITQALRDDIHSKIIGLPRSFHMASTPGRLMARIIADVNMVRDQMMNSLLTLVRNVVLFFVGVLILVSADWRIALTAFLGLIPYALIVNRVRPLIHHVAVEARHSNSSLWGLCSQKLESMKAIVAYGRERLEYLFLHRLNACMLRDVLHQQKLSVGVSRAAAVIVAMTTSAVFVMCARKVMDQRMTLGEMMFIYGASATLFSPILVLTELSFIVSNLLVVMQRLTSIFDRPHELPEAPGAVDFPTAVSDGIKVRRLCFRYAEDGDWVLRDLDMRIQAGQWTCIMGPSGCGKSTLLHLLARLYDPTTGWIRVDGIPLKDVGFKSLRRHMALVPQEAQIFRGTVRDNITYGDAKARPGEIMAAAEAADCHRFIMELPVQYETVIGEKGTSLSGGQRQRISLARALLTNPEVLLLDDVTSALDAATEQKIQETLTHLMAGKTAVIVSQRASMAVRCDYIYVMAPDGSLEAQGTHAELRDGDGFYGRLWRKQMDTEPRGSEDASGDASPPDHTEVKLGGQG